MKEYYSIGETAKLLGVSTQTLRYYDREGILRPETINEETGYRYYSYMQFSQNRPHQVPAELRPLA